VIQEGLSYLMKGRTTFVIAHRLSTIRRADQILVVESRTDCRARHARNAVRGSGPVLRFVYEQHGIDANLFLAPGEGDSVPKKRSGRARRVRRHRRRRVCCVAERRKRARGAL